MCRQIDPRSLCAHAGERVWTLVLRNEWKHAAYSNIRAHHGRKTQRNDTVHRPSCLIIRGLTGWTTSAVRRDLTPRAGSSCFHV